MQFYLNLNTHGCIIMQQFQSIKCFRKEELKEGNEERGIVGETHFHLGLKVKVSLLDSLYMNAPSVNSTGFVLAYQY